MNQLKIIKPFETGKFGYLIEDDAGYISPDDKRNKSFVQEIKKLDKGAPIIAEPLVVYVVLQKYGVRNRNGRIYPEALLKRENERYQDLIRDNRAIGELDHPECHRESAEILTTEGWKYIKDVKLDEKVYTLNPETNIIEEKKITKKIIKDYKGKMVSIKGRNIDLLVTPNHKFWVIDRYGKGSFISAMDIHENKIKGLAKTYIPKTGKWESNDSEEYFTLKGLTENEISFNLPYSRKVEMMSDLKIDKGLWMAFMGIYLSDGCVAQSKTKKRVSKILEDGSVEYGFESSSSGYLCKITQKKEESKNLIRELMEELPFEYKEYECSDDVGKVDFKITDARLHKYLKQFGKSHDKFIDSTLKNYDVNSLNIFVDWFLLGDGRTRGKYKSSELFSTSKKLIDDLQEILIKTGRSGNLIKEARDFDRVFTESNGDKRIIKKGNSKTMNFLHISTTKGIYLDKRFLKTELVDYDDKVYCVDVPNHIFYVRDNNKACWNGNSSIINGDRISHNIVETWWEGSTLMGKMKIIMSPGFINLGIISCKGDLIANYIRNGIKIGVSSRGVGSLEQINGENVVQDDFELICWDVVTTPSTPGSWIFTEPQEAQPYVENFIRENDDKLIDGLNKFLLG